MRRGGSAEGRGQRLDVDGAFEGPRARLWGRCVLVRPDRFVAFETAPEDVGRALEALDRRLRVPDA